MSVMSPQNSGNHFSHVVEARMSLSSPARSCNGRLFAEEVEGFQEEDHLSRSYPEAQAVSARGFSFAGPVDQTRLESQLRQENKHPGHTHRFSLGHHVRVTSHPCFSAVLQVAGCTDCFTYSSHYLDYVFFLTAQRSNV